MLTGRNLTPIGLGNEIWISISLGMRHHKRFLKQVTRGLWLE